MEEAINGLHIIPVSISYEYDPCDRDKAKELYEVETNGSFTKSEKSDISSIAKERNVQKNETNKQTN